jgi:hypothetical protein
MRPDAALMRPGAALSPRCPTPATSGMRPGVSLAQSLAA